MNFNVFGLLHKNSLSLFILGHKNSFEEIKIDFPEDVVNKSDIFDAEKFSFELKNTLIRRPELKGSEILFLVPPEKVFTKLVELNNTSIEEEKGRFYAESPVSEEESHLSIQTKGNWVQFIAVPKKLVTDIENSLAKVGFKAQFLPLAQLIGIGFGTKNKQLVAFSLEDHLNLLVCQNGLATTTLELDTAKKEPGNIVDKITKLRTETGMEDLSSLILLNSEKQLGEMLEASGVKVSQIGTEETPFTNLFKIISENRGDVAKSLVGIIPKMPKRTFKVPWRKIGSMFLVILLLFLFVGLFIFFKDLGSKFDQNSNIALSPSPTSQPSPSPEATTSAQPLASPSASVTPKSSFKVLVVNGNGLPGDAGRFAKVLNSLGYTKTETDTADTQGQRATTLAISNNVPAANAEEITEAVKGEYIQVNVTSNPTADNDIEITLGTKK